ncbi:carboxylesterase/lipase family protein [Lentzea albidocapillata]|uniref:Carboxylic ester hydrolase n=1 Tax=Lentzea albidocapillata TaxID=40571 RepID=A0A1W2CEC3_9PSEU|nr:carboxylesterase family protein [Lentzea albidocapillata]SMC83222.1 para-nitrobenzyl esterase [Lentzea albidocapillata]
MARFTTAALAAAMTLAVIQVPIARADVGGRIVRTDKGAVAGTVTSTDRTFGNIPFAAAPVGANRWRDPQPVTPWQGVRDATRPAPVCAQTPQLGDPASDVEDCLYLNVTTPATAPAKPRPVMVWIHGGGFINGSASGYDARWLATRNDAVVVTVNYRLGVFGFFGYPGLPGSGAFGLADQQAALRWVQRNIRAFGGDARDVTVLGESAGGLSVCAHLASPGAAGLFGKAVIQSGPCGLSVPTDQPGGLMTFWKPREDVEKQGSDLRLGCSDITCLRALPTSALLAVHGAFAQPAFHTRVLPINPHVAQNTGRTHRVPTLVGSTRDEMTLYAGLIYPEPIPEPGYPAKAAAVFGEDLGAQVVARYPVNGNGDARDELAAALTDRSWSCPTHETRQRLGRRMPVAGYEFAQPDMPMIFPGMPPFPGGYRAYHASELPLLFEFEGLPLTAAQRELSGYLLTAWGRFARTGDPGWRAPVQSLRAGAIGPADFVKDHQCDFWGQQH